MSEDTSGAAATSGAADTAKRLGKWAVGGAVWAAEYSIWSTVAGLAWAWYAAVWLIRGTLKTGGAAILLIFLPIIGWIILYFHISAKRQRERHHQELLGALGKSSAAPMAKTRPAILKVPKPLFLDWVKS